jgi:ATP-binding protein involved in chromosome partitioning
MAGDFFGEGGGERLAQERNLTFLGRIPLQAGVRVGGDIGRPVTITDPETPAAVALRQMSEAVAARVSVVMLQNDGIIPINIIG